MATPLPSRKQYVGECLGYQLDRSTQSGRRDRRATIVGPLLCAVGALGAPTPLFAALVADELRRLFDLHEDDLLREIARGKMEGCTNEEIAARHSLALRTVERKLALIRRVWEHI